MDSNMHSNMDSNMDTMDDPSMPVDLDDVDLFGGPVDLTMPSRPPSKQLQQRLDELRTRGCCQGISWSKQGTIASVSANGRDLELRYLRTHPKHGSWGLSEPTPCIPLSPFSGARIVHLAWAATGSPELAVIDAVGRVSILTFSMTLNRPYLLRSWDNDPIDDLHAVVGCYWLPLIPHSKQYNVIHGPALREGNGYRYESTFVHAFGPYHPSAAKSALLCVTAGGLLKLFFSQNNNKILDVSVELLESTTTSDDLVTHASIRSEKGGTLLIALATASKRLMVVRAAIQWGLPQSDKQPPPVNVQLNPVLQQKPVAITSWLQYEPSSEPHLDASMAQLSHIEVLPTAVAGPNQPWSPPVVLTVRSYFPISGSSYSPELQSVIDRWELLHDQPQTLHPAFGQLGSKATQTSNLPTLTRLKKLDPIVINKVVISIQAVQFGKVICIAFSDGTVQYRDRFTMNEIYNEISVNKVMVLNQVGFQFAEDTPPCLEVAFSPTNCSFVQTCEDGKIRWNSLRYPVPDIGSTPHDAQYSAIVAALTTAVSTASFNQMSYDDILAIARQFADKPRFAYDWMMEIVRMLKINVDYSEESHHDQLVRNHSLQLCLSILNHMGFRGEFKPKAFCGKFASLALNVRNIVILVTIASNAPVNLKEKLSPLDEPEVVDALAGCAKWTLDLLAYLTDCLFNLLDDPKFMSLLSQPHFVELVPYLQSKNEVALHLLLCSSTRGFLSAACRRLQHLETLSNRAIQYYQAQQAPDQAGGAAAATAASAAARASNPLNLAYQKMHHYTSSSLIQVEQFDRLLSTLGADIRQAYHMSLSRFAQSAAQAAAAAKGSHREGQQASDAAMKRAQAHCELTLLLANNPPSSFLPVLAKFFNQEVRAFRQHANPASLFFGDYSILEVEDSLKSLQNRKLQRRYVDVFKRVELIAPSEYGAGTEEAGGNASPGASGLWRRCVRCASVMEDVYGHRPGYTFVLAQQRKCSCGGSWGLLTRGSLVM